MMEVRIRQVEANQFGALLAYLIGFIILIFSPLALIKAIIDKNIMEVLLTIPVVLFVYTIIGFFVGYFGAKLYNRAARKVGGLKIELDLNEVENES